MLFNNKHNFVVSKLFTLFFVIGASFLVSGLLTTQNTSAYTSEVDVYINIRDMNKAPISDIKAIDFVLYEIGNNGALTSKLEGKAGIIRPNGDTIAVVSAENVIFNTFDTWGKYKICLKADKTKCGDLQITSSGGYSRQAIIGITKAEYNKLYPVDIATTTAITITRSGTPPFKNKSYPYTLIYYSVDGDKEVGSKNITTPSTDKSPIKMNADYAIKGAASGDYYVCLKKTNPKPDADVSCSTTNFDRNSNPRKAVLEFNIDDSGVVDPILPPIPPDPGDIPADPVCVETTFFGCIPTKSTGGIEGSGIWTILTKVLEFMTMGIGLLAVGGVIYGAALYASAGGSVEQVKKAKSYIIGTVIGIICYALLYSFINFLIPGGVL